MSYYRWKRLIYRFKRRFGTQITVVETTSTTRNVLSGNIVIVDDSFTIKRAILLPEEASTIFKYLPQFSYGGYFDKSFRRIFIDTSDIPSGNTIEQDSRIRINSYEYEVKFIEDFTPIPILGVIIQRILLKESVSGSSS